MTQMQGRRGNISQAVVASAVSLIFLFCCAAFGSDRDRDRHGRSIRSAATKRGDAAGFLINALEAGDHRDLLVFREALDQLGAIHIHNAGGGMRIVGQDRQLPALPGAGVDAHAFQHDREQPGGDLFSGCKGAAWRAQSTSWLVTPDMAETTTATS